MKWSTVLESNKSEAGCSRLPRRSANGTLKLGAGTGIRTRTYSLASYDTTLILFQHGATESNQTTTLLLTRKLHYLYATVTKNFSLHYGVSFSKNAHYLYLILYMLKS